MLFFAIEKPPDDIRVVWAGTGNGVNVTMFTPSFQLPTLASYHWVVEAEMEAGDFDIGEQFFKITCSIPQNVLILVWIFKENC
jgi:hypothetical protein